MSAPGLPVRGSMGVSELPWLLFTYSVCMSYEGTTCWGKRPTSNVSITWKVAGSITLTVDDSLLGTYTRDGMSFTLSARSSAPVNR
jgi:hypothetical protein